jgi:hypothetical protein
MAPKRKKKIKRKIRRKRAKKEAREVKWKRKVGGGRRKQRKPGKNPRQEKDELSQWRALATGRERTCGSHQAHLLITI